MSGWLGQKLWVVGSVLLTFAAWLQYQLGDRCGHDQVAARARAMNVYVCVLISLWASPVFALAELSKEVEEGRQVPTALSSVSVPCLRESDERRVAVTWEIRNAVTGERRNIGNR